MATVLTYVGEEWAAARMVGDSDTLDIAATHIGWGTGTTTAAKSDTALAAEVDAPTPTRGSATVSLTGSGQTAKFQAVATLEAGASLAIKEAGLFSASTGGSMFVRGDFGVINLNSGDQITFTITIDPQ